MLEKCLTRFFPHEYIDGLWVGVVEEDKDTKNVAIAVTNALSLIKKYDTSRYDYLLRDLKRIVVILLSGSIGHFEPKNDTCYLDYRAVKELPIDVVASIIVHEATHARPCLRKIGYPQELRYRVERICARQEIMFSKKLPDGTKLREQAERYLALDPSNWSDENIMKRRLEGGLANAKHLGWPAWPTKFIHAASQVRQRLRARNKNLD